MAAEGLFAIVFLGVLAFPIVLYYLVRAEHDRGEEMDRTDAERVARRDVPDDGTRGHRDDRRRRASDPPDEAG